MLACKVLSMIPFFYIVIVAAWTLFSQIQHNFQNVTFKSIVVIFAVNNVFGLRLLTKNICNVLNWFEQERAEPEQAL